MTEQRGSSPHGRDRSDRGRHGERGERRGDQDRRRADRGQDRERRPRPSGPRETALAVLHEVEVEDAYANLVLPGRMRAGGLSGRDASLATELTYGTLRMRGLYDAIVAEAADRDPAGLDPLTRQAVRMGAHQLLNMRVQDHAAVSETIDALRVLGGGRAAGLANAVLRRVSEADAQTWIGRLSEGLDAARTLSLVHSHPGWIVRALGQALRSHRRSDAASGDLESLLAADNAPAKVTLAALPGLADPQELAAQAGHRGRLSPLAVVLDGGDPRDIDGVDEARVRVQDEGSQLVALAFAEAALSQAATSETAELAPHWLDLCAGPGGKTAVLAALAAQLGGTVDAVDTSAHRAQLVRDSVRARAASVTVEQADGREFAASRPGRYSGVLVDAPCSGLGALRRRPEARWRRRPEDVAALAPVQVELLRAALTACAPGGVVAYATCSPHWAETGVIVDEALAGRGDVTVLDAAAVLAQVTGEPAGSFASASRGSGRFAQLWPDVHGTDGMFLALLRRDA